MARKRKSVDTSTYSGRVAKRLVKLREEAGLSVEDAVSKMASIDYTLSQATWKFWENSRTQMPLNAIPFVCKVLKAKPHDLLPKR